MADSAIGGEVYNWRNTAKSLFYLPGGQSQSSGLLNLIGGFMDIPFGKYAGTPVEDLPDDYLEWLSSLDNLRERLRAAVDEELERRAIFANIRRKLTPGSISLLNQIIDTGYRCLAKEFHPDVGGDSKKMVDLNNAVAYLRVKARELE